MKYKFEELVEHMKKYGFFFQNSEIYGGLANSWDYGPLAIEIKRKLKKIWWKHFINNFEFNYGLDTGILMNPIVWKSSGHIDNFSDPLVDCKSCKHRFRPDKLIEQKNKTDVSNFDSDKIDKLIIENNIKCPKCNKSDFTNVRKFKLMFQVNNSVTDKENDFLYLRPETAQGIFMNFKNIQRVMSTKLPFGIGQIGKSFRNEISPNNFIFRTREFEQMELEFFYSKFDKKNWFEFWVNNINDFLIKELNINEKNISKKTHSKLELAHYAKKTVDFNYRFPFGDGELWGIADRGDFDLSNHQINSKTDLRYFDQEKKEKYLPYVIEPSVGVDRLVLAILCDAYKKENINNKERIVLKLKNNLVPIEICLLPLFKKPDLISGINEIFLILKNNYTININTIGSIGKRYFKADAIGIPFCLTYDYDSLKDDSVTIRYRDTMQQERIKIKDLKDFFLKKFN